MEPRVSLVTLGVSNLARSKRFYEHLGWRGQEVEETVFIQAGALVLTLWNRDKLATDCGVETGTPGPFGGIALAHNVRSAEEVDAVITQAADAGAGVTRPAAKTFYGGYAGVFADPDGHLWEIAYNPGFPLNERGEVQLPDFSKNN